MKTSFKIPLVLLALLLLAGSVGMLVNPGGLWGAAGYMIFMALYEIKMWILLAGMIIAGLYFYARKKEKRERGAEDAGIEDE